MWVDAGLCGFLRVGDVEGASGLASGRLDSRCSIGVLVEHGLTDFTLDYSGLLGIGLERTGAAGGWARKGMKEHTGGKRQPKILTHGGHRRKRNHAEGNTRL